MLAEADSDNIGSPDNGDERRPLLKHPVREPILERRPQAKDVRRRVLALLYATIIALNISLLLQEAPSIRLFEIYYCRVFYEEHNPTLIGDNGVVDEQYCKGDVVQSQIAFLKGWLNFFKYLPAVFLAVPYGILADKYGRKYLVLVNVISFSFQAAWLYFVCALPQLDIRLIWLQVILQIFGGGLMVATALIFVIINDITPKSETSNAFFRVMAVYLGSYFFVPPISGLLMERSPWLPMSIGLVIQVLTIPIAMALPETLGLQKEDEAPFSEQPDNEDRINDELSPDSDTHSITLEKHSLLRLMLAPFISLFQNYRFLFKDWRLLFIISLYPIRMFMNTLDELLIQYLPKRYAWSFASSTYIWSFQSAISILTLLLILPWFSSYLHRNSISVERKDLLIMRISLIAVALGYLLEGLAPSIYILFLGVLMSNLGAGLGACMRALITTYVHKDEVAKLYTVLAIMETGGLSIGGPVAAWLFKAGMARGSGIWLGLPWLVIALCLSLGAIGTWVVRLQGPGVEKAVGLEEGGFVEGLERAAEVHGPQGAPTVGLD